MTEMESRTEVTIITDNYRIDGEIALIKGARLTDFIVESQSFVAVTDATVMNHDGKPIMTASFININRSSIEIIAPSDLVDLT